MQSGLSIQDQVNPNALVLILWSHKNKKLLCEENESGQSPQHERCYNDVLI